ncbi:MAG: putative phage tail protein [Blastomonas sp.]
MSYLAADYGAQLRQLLPSGAAFRAPADSNLARLLDALAEEFARIDARADDVIDEADPRTTLELLPDWERVLGLPDACTGAPDNVGERRAALRQKITGLGGQSQAYFIELAARLGYVVTISEHRAARLGMRLGERLNGPDWQFAWTVHVEPFDGDLPDDQPFLAQARIGDELGVRLRGFGALDLECVIRRAAPAHTIVLFAYEAEPEALFWIDLTDTGEE